MFVHVFPLCQILTHSTCLLRQVEGDENCETQQMFYISVGCVYFVSVCIYASFMHCAMFKEIPSIA